MADTQAVISSVLYGPDRRTRINPDTRGVMFVTYAPSGIAEDWVRRHLSVLREYVLIVSPGAEAEEVEIWGKGD